MAAPRTRLTAQERREDVLAAAIAEFSVTGYHGTPTEAIAKRAGISQPYLFRLYGTKKELFLACVERCFDLTLQTFQRAVEGLPDGEDRLPAMGEAYIAMLADRELLLFQLQTYAASADDDVRALAHRRYEQLRDDIAKVARVPEADAVPFLAQGMLLNIAAALDLDPERWIWQGDAEQGAA
jgi:AcrR family transcriptional regulator